MRDILIALVVLCLMAAAFYRPWLMTFAYLYADLLQPQRLSYYLIKSVPVNFIIAVSAVIFFLFDKKKNLRISGVQMLMVLFTAWFTLVSTWAILPDQQFWFKWDAAWKAVLFSGAFVPMVLATRRRIDAAVALFVLCVGLVSISGGLKTLMGGGGYENLRMIVDTNQGLYESSTISTVAMASIPLILYLWRDSPLVGRNRWTLLFAIGLIVAAILVSIGVEARTGVVTGGMLLFLLFLRSRRKLPLAAGVVAAAIVALPFVPQTFIDRAETITKPETDTSASTRLAVWKWTLDFVEEHPFGGGFRVFRINEIEYTVVDKDENGNILGFRQVTDRGRGFHSSYFEVLGETGWPGLAMYLSIIGFSLIGLYRLRRRYAKGPPDKQWAAHLADALIMAIIIYCAGGLFVAIAFQTTLYLLVGIGIALRWVMSAQEAEARKAAAPDRLRRRLGLPPAQPSPMPAE